MLGAILGDIIGSPYEFGPSCKTKDFPLFTPASRVTDDSVMTLAVADALMHTTPASDDRTVRRAMIVSMQRLGRAYPDAGYGLRFSRWLVSPHPRPYESWGNGSAMRVSAVGWFYDDLPSVLRGARLSAEVSHNHPEGIRGAQAVAAAVFLARTGHSKAEIRSCVSEQFGYDLSRTCGEIRPDYDFRPSCQETVPQAITAFLEGDSFEDVIRTAVSLGGDCDTLTAIAGSIGEAFYGIPEALRQEGLARLPAELCRILSEFESQV